VTLPGGKGANQAATAALLGYPTYFVGQTGRDAPAGVLRTALTHCGVDLTHCASVDAPTGQAIIVLQPDGENSIIIVGGANTQWTAPGDEALRQVAASGMLLLQREVPESVSLAAARAASSAGVPVILDAGGNEEPICEELLRLVTVLSPNETELSRLTGLPTDTEANILAAASALQQRGVDTVLVKLGAQGSLLVPPHNGAPVRQPAFKADKVRVYVVPGGAACAAACTHPLLSNHGLILPLHQVVDTTGAGDCFTASFAVALLQGRSHGEALRFASAAACLCVQRMGAMPSLPRRQEVDDFLAQR
jgi:ribokinase